MCDIRKGDLKVGWTFFRVKILYVLLIIAIIQLKEVLDRFWPW